jgi:subtilisin family serine protease
MRPLLATAIALALAAATPAASADALIAPALETALASSGPHKVIVTFRDRAAAASIAEIATDYLLLKELPIAGAVLTRAQIEDLAARDDVESIYLDEKLRYYNYEAGKITGGHFVHDEYGAKGKGVTVAVIDSGIDANHPDLRLGSKTIQNVKLVGDLGLAGVSAAVENQPNTDTSSGHGTHVAGTVGGTGAASANDLRRRNYYAGIAPEAGLIGLGTGEGLSILFALQAFDWVLANQERYSIDVVTNSWGSSNYVYDPNHPINRASYETYRRGMVVTFAAGNDGPGDDTLNPYAVVPWVVNVGSGTKSKAISDFSSRGVPGDEYKHVDVVAPGSGICSTRAPGTAVGATGPLVDAANPAYSLYYHCISGTSMATPFVAGTAALMLQVNPDLSPDQVEAILMQTAEAMPGLGFHAVGGGYINVARAVEMAADVAGERAAFLAGATAWSNQGAWNAVADGNAKVALEGRWRTVSDAGATDGGYRTATVSRKDVPRARLTFAGTAVQLRFPLTTDGGDADVYVDGKLHGRISFLAAAARDDGRYAIAGLARGVHRVELRGVRGRIHFDGALVDGALLDPGVAYVEDTVRFTGTIGPSAENVQVADHALAVGTDAVSIAVTTAWDGVADLDVYLLDPDGVEVASAATLGNPERLEFQVATPGEYTIRVSGYASVLTDYRVDAVVGRAVPAD